MQQQGEKCHVQKHVEHARPLPAMGKRGIFLGWVFTMTDILLYMISMFLNHNLNIHFSIYNKLETNTAAIVN